MTNSLEKQNALSDLEVLKKSILSKGNLNPLGIASVDAHKKLHMGALFFSGLFILADLPAIDLLTSDVMGSATSPSMQTSGIVSIGVMLSVFLAVSYAVLLIHAKSNRQQAGEYMSRYFLQFGNLSVVSDVLIKYAFFSALVLAEKPEWIAPALTIFIGDWVAQRRFFILKPAQSVMISLACFALGAYMLASNIYLIAIPLAVFIGTTALSYSNILKFQAKNSQANESVA